ncbi:MAG: hypothetical protein SFY81_06370 [Verrucomicrobiota bacterium]|nr:hypothetical protein [Verrucomicrobiota bacterium]
MKFPCAASFFALFIGILLTTPTQAAEAEVVYENSQNYLAQFRPSPFEYGDQITLTGENRIITDFGFEYFARFTSSGDEYARLRFYRNDGPEFKPGYEAPKTLFYDSGLFSLEAGFHSVFASGLNLQVPDEFTWTVQFYGIDSSADEAAGLLFYSPPTTGSSSDDFWERENGVWRVEQTPDQLDNFAAKVTAISGPLLPSEILSITFTAGQAKVTASVTTGKRYALEFSSDLNSGIWERQPVSLQATNAVVEFFDTVAPSNPARFYRIVELGNHVLLAGNETVITSPAVSGKTYVLEYSDDLTTGNWFRIPGQVVALGDRVTLVDSTINAGTMRFYRVVALD